MADYGKVSIDEASMASNKTGRDLLVDQDRQYTEDEKRVAIMVQAAYRGSNQRKDFSKLQAQGLSADAVEFQRAVKTANGVKTVRGNDFEWIKAHFVGGAAHCAHQSSYLGKHSA